MYAFQLSFPFPGVVPAFLHIVQNRKILRNDLIIHFFWHKFQPTMFPALFFLSSLAGCALKHITCLIQWKDRQKTNLQKVQTERVLPSQLTEIFLNLTLQTVKHLQKMDWQGTAQMQKWMAQARADSASSAANDTASADSAKKVILLSAHTCTSSLNGLYMLKYQSSSNTWLSVESSTMLSMNTQNQTDATSTAQNTNKQATIYPCNPQSNYF